MMPLQPGPAQPFIAGDKEPWAGGWRRTLLLALWALWAAWAACQLLRDRWALTTVFFYLPAPVLLALLIGVALVVRWTGGRRISSLLLLLAILPAAVIRNDSSPRYARPEINAGPTLRLAHWNVCRGCGGWERQVQQLLNQHADLVVLSEAPRDVAPRKLAARFGADYTGTRSGGLLVLVRGQLLTGQAIPAPRGLQLLDIVCQVAGNPLHLLVVDVVSNPLVRRDPLLRRVVAELARRQPDLVVGDFNSPRRSRAFDSLPRGWAHAWDRAGGGWPYSWPSPVPVLALDHTLVGPRLVARNYVLASGGASDHRLQRFDFGIRRRWVASR
jgi:vancomycin resistance protein VanJ